MTTDVDKLVGVNIDKEIVQVEHAKLKRLNEVSIFKSYCPVCELGALLVRRDKNTFQLQAEDRCILCGQKFVYTDIADINKSDKIQKEG